MADVKMLLDRAGIKAGIYSTSGGKCRCFGSEDAAECKKKFKSIDWTAVFCPASTFVLRYF